MVRDPRITVLMRSVKDVQGRKFRVSVGYFILGNKNKMYIPLTSFSNSFGSICSSSFLSLCLLDWVFQYIYKIFDFR